MLLKQEPEVISGDRVLPGSGDGQLPVIIPIDDTRRCKQCCYHGLNMGVCVVVSLKNALQHRVCLRVAYDPMLHFLMPATW